MEPKSITFSDVNSNLTSLESLASQEAKKWKVENPELPFWKAFATPLAPNSTLIISGRASHHARSFTVNFLLDLKKESDIAFHFNARFGQHVVCNSSFDSLWDNEEIFGLDKFPFSKGQEFKLEFFLTANEFLVAVDRFHFCRFGHRSSPRQISKVEVLGDIEIYEIYLTSKTHYPPSVISDNTLVSKPLRVPYWRYFVESVIPSTQIHIRGNIPDKAKRLRGSDTSFTVDLCTDWSNNPDIAFHLNPRMKENYVACNTRRNGIWGEEEPNAWGKLPFSKGYSFALDILVTDRSFLVTVNGKKLCTYSHRVPLNKIKYLEISKCIVLRKVKLYREKTSIPLFLGELNSSIIFHSLDVPFRREFVDPLVPKTDLLVCGVVEKDAIRFAVNLLSLSGDICFHFNPRFDQNYVARNARIGGSWGTEEAQASSRNPFQRAAQFTLELFVTRYEFLVSVNGKHFCTFSHRVSLSEIKTIEIDGDLTLSKVELNTKDQYPSITEIPSISSPIDKLSLQETPLMRTLDEVVKPGTELEIRGRVKLLPWSFYINIQDSTNYWPHPQIGYHLRVRMNDSNPGVVFNSWEDNSWGKEESVALSRRFTPGKEFLLAVSCTRSAFVAKVDGHHLYDFRYRAHSNSLRLNTLYVHGDIVVSSLALVHS